MKTDFKKALCITLFLDSIILIIIYFRNLSYYDLLFVTNIILCHVTFLIGLSLNDTDLIDPCHYALFITLLLKSIIIHLINIRRDFLAEIHQPSSKATVVSSIKRRMCL